MPWWTESPTLQQAMLTFEERAKQAAAAQFEKEKKQSKSELSEWQRNFEKSFGIKVPLSALVFTEDPSDEYPQGPRVWVDNCRFRALACDVEICCTGWDMAWRCPDCGVLVGDEDPHYVADMVWVGRALSRMRGEHECGAETIAPKIACPGESMKIEVTKQEKALIRAALRLYIDMQTGLAGDAGALEDRLR